MTFGRRLRQLRLEGFFNQVELAEVFKVSKTAICNWEHDKRSPSKDTILEIARYFNVDLDYLMGLTEQKGTFANEVAAVNELPAIITDETNTINTILENYLMDNLLKFEKEIGPLTKSDIAVLKNAILISLESLKITDRNKHKAKKQKF